MTKLITVQLHPDTLALLAVIADTERNSANHSAEFWTRRNKWTQAADIRALADAWAITASNLNIAAERVEG